MDKVETFKDAQPENGQRCWVVLERSPGWSPAAAVFHDVCQIQVYAEDGDDDGLNHAPLWAFEDGMGGAAYCRSGDRWFSTDTKDRATADTQSA
jgi:hypothetical protein